MSSFQEFMVDALAGQVDLAGKSVLELGSDPPMLSAKALLAKGASTVISSDVHDIWHGSGHPGVVPAIIDARNICAVLPPRSVDVVYGINILEHLPDIPMVMESVSKVLRPGGMALLHGHPLWTSARGHHALLGSPAKWDFIFWDTTNPIPLWGHLTHTPEQMREKLQHLPQEWVDRCMYWCFETDEITRTPRRRMIEEIKAGPASVRHMWEDRLEAPDEETLAQIKSSPWWDAGEDYAVRGITFVLDAER